MEISQRLNFLILLVKLLQKKVRASTDILQFFKLTSVNSRQLMKISLTVSMVNDLRAHIRKTVKVFLFCRIFG